MKTRAALVGLLVISATAWWTHRGSPEQRIAHRLGGICAIAADNVATPARGVDRLFAYLGDNTPDTTRDVATLVVEVQRISDERRQEERARRANATMRAPLDQCHDSLDRFLTAVEQDEQASRKMEDGIERLERTLILLFGNSAPNVRAFLHR